MTINMLLAIITAMRYGLLILLIAGFLSITVLGFTGMDIDGRGHMNCIATAVQGKVCPEALGILGFINFHANAIKVFSTAVFEMSILALFPFLLAGFISTKISSSLRSALPIYRFPQFLLTSASLPQETFFDWLALHEKRDPVLI